MIKTTEELKSLRRKEEKTRSKREREREKGKKAGGNLCAFT